MVHDRIQIRIGLVVQVLDELTEQPVNSIKQKTEVRLSPGAPPISKGDGYYLFLQPFEPGAVLSIQAAGYQTQELRLESERAFGNLQKVYLKPNKQYPMTAEIYGIYGTANPGEVLGITYNQRCRMGRLEKDYDAGETDIAIYTRGAVIGDWADYLIRERKSSSKPNSNPEENTGSESNSNPEENTDSESGINSEENIGSESGIRPEEKSGLKQEFLKMYPQKEPDSEPYRLEEPLQYSYHKNLAELYPVIWLKADDRGEFFWYWKRLREDREVLSCDIWTTEGKSLCHLEIPAGKRQKAEI